MESLTWLKWIFVIIWLIIRIDSKGSGLHKQYRVGYNETNFLCYKFRTMKQGTPIVGSEKVSRDSITRVGKFLRKSRLDELPQIFNVLKGDMSFVGPRAILYNHNDIIEMRTKNDVHKLIPGITGWAQINGRDDISAFDKVMLDTEYLKKRSIWFDLKILWITFFKVLRRDGISH